MTGTWVDMMKSILNPVMCTEKRPFYAREEVKAKMFDEYAHYDEYYCESEHDWNEVRPRVEGDEEEAAAGDIVHADILCINDVNSKTAWIDIIDYTDEEAWEVETRKHNNVEHGVEDICRVQMLNKRLASDRDVEDVEFRE